MSGWPELNIGFGEVLFIFPVGLALVLFIYGKSYPTPTLPVRRALAACRGAAVLLILAIVAEPALDFVESRIVKPQLVLLVDISKSMETEEDGLTRLEQIATVTGSEEFRSLVQRVDIKAFGFAQDVQPLRIDELGGTTPSGSATDISSALRVGLKGVNARGRPISVLLMSDGVHNLGDDPVEAARAMEVPVFSLKTGRVTQEADAQVVEVDVPEIGYVGQSLSIQARLRSWGFSGKSQEVELYQEDRVVDRESIMLGEDGEDQLLTFEITPFESGPLLLRVVVPTMVGDRSKENNESLAFVKILERKVETLIVAGGPGADLTFAQRGIAADSTLSLSTLVQKSHGEFYEVGAIANAEIPAADVFIVMDPGPELMRGKIAEEIANRVQSGAGLLFVGGQRSFASWDDDSPISVLLPAEASHPRPNFIQTEISLRLTDHGHAHPVTRVAMNESRDSWSQLPPLPGYFPLDRIGAGGIVLVESRQEVNIPLITVVSRNGGRVIGVASGELWRLDLLSSGAHASPWPMRDFWANAVKWVATESPSGRVRVSSESNVYMGGEDVLLVGQVLDELLRPVDGADLQVTLNEGGSDLRMLEAGSGTYRGIWRGLDPGSYSFVARAKIDGEVIGQDSGTFIVEQHSVESISVTPNELLLSELSRVTGGRSGRLDDWRSIVALIPLERRVSETNTSVGIWDFQWLAAATILLLTMEWYIRKRHGMV